VISSQHLALHDANEKLQTPCLYKEFAASGGDNQTRAFGCVSEK
jgi:hypothetical protein